jgi:hypothetical protein
MASVRAGADVPRIALGIVGKSAGQATLNVDGKPLL